MCVEGTVGFTEEVSNRWEGPACCAGGQRGGRREEEEQVPTSGPGEDAVVSLSQQPNAHMQLTPAGHTPCCHRLACSFLKGLT